MHPQIRARLNELKAQVLSHPAVRQVHIRGEEITVTRGYLRIRLVLQSRETIEAFVYLFDQEGVVSLRDYTLHWQHEDGALIQRWDTAPHHPELENFPHHTHTLEFYQMSGQSGQRSEMVGGCLNHPIHPRRWPDSQYTWRQVRSIA